MFFYHQCPFNGSLCLAYEIKCQFCNKPCPSLQYLTPVCLSNFCSCNLSLHPMAAAQWECSPFPKHGRLLPIAIPLHRLFSLHTPSLFLLKKKKNLSLSVKTSSSGKPSLVGSFVHTSIINHWVGSNPASPAKLAISKGPLCSQHQTWCPECS